MSLTNWLLESIKSNWDGDFPSDLKRINRDDSEIMEDNLRSRKADLEESNFVGVSKSTEDRTPLGTDAEEIEVLLDVRVEALHEDAFGQIAGEQAFNELVDSIKQAIETEATAPSITTEHRATFVRAYIQNEEDTNQLFKDYYINEFSVRLRGVLDG